MMRVQLQRLPELVGARSAAAAGYGQLLGDLVHVALPAVLPDRTTPGSPTSSPWIQLSTGTPWLWRSSARGVGCTFGTFASHLQPIYGSAQECSRFGRPVRPAPCHPDAREPG